MEVHGPRRKGEPLLGPFFWHFVALAVALGGSWAVWWFRS
jgi:hypothetical protein